MPSISKGIGRPVEPSVFAFAVRISSKGVGLTPIGKHRGLKAGATGSAGDEALPLYFSLTSFAFHYSVVIGVELGF